MSETTSHEHLVRLHELLLQERECAKGLDMKGLQAINRQKEGLLKILQEVKNLAPEDRALAEAIQRENQRNGYLFWGALNWVQEMMGLLSRQLASESYGSSGGTTLIRHGGRLLSGRI